MKGSSNKNTKGQNEIKEIQKDKWINIEKKEGLNVYIRDEGLYFRSKTIRIEWTEEKDPCVIYSLIEEIIERNFYYQGIINTITIGNNIFIKLKA